MIKKWGKVDGKYFYIQEWFSEENKNNVLICPSVNHRSLSGIRFIITELAKSLFCYGNNVTVFDYPHTGNSGVHIEKLTYKELLDTCAEVIDIYQKDHSAKYQVLIGFGASNFLLSKIVKTHEFSKIVYINPDFEAPKIFIENMNDKQQCIESKYELLVKNGSDDIFKYLDLENPNEELRMWESICGPFYSGENESIGYQLLEELASLFEFEDSTDNLVFYWNELKCLEYFNSDIKKIYLGSFSNETYPLNSSLIYDRLITELNKQFNNKSDSRIIRSENYISSIENTLEVVSISSGLEILSGFLYVPEKIEKEYIIVFEHALGNDCLGEYGSWHTLANELKNLGYICYRYDHIGAGLSGGTFDNTLYSNYVTELEVVLEYLKQRFSFSNLIVISWSAGAITTLLAGEKLNCELKGIVFWSPMLPVHPLKGSSLRLTKRKNGLYFPLSPLWLSIDYLKEEKNLDTQDLYSKIKGVPQLLVTGELDNTLLYEVIKNSKKVHHEQIANVGHCFSRSTITTVINKTKKWIVENFK